MGIAALNPSYGLIETAVDSVIASGRKVPAAIWSLGKTGVDNAVRKSA